MSRADQLRSQKASSTDPGWLEREAQMAEATEPCRERYRLQKQTLFLDGKRALMLTRQHDGICNSDLKKLQALIVRLLNEWNDENPPLDCKGVVIGGKVFPISHLFVSNEHRPALRCARCGLFLADYKWPDPVLE